MNIFIMILESLASSVIGGALITLPVFLIWHAFVAPVMRLRWRDKAINDGHVVEAHLVSSSERRSRPSGKAYYDDTVAVYEYCYDGQTHRYRSRKNGTPPETLELFFRRNPRYAAAEHEIGQRESPCRTVFLVATVIFILMALAA